MESVEAVEALDGIIKTGGFGGGAVVAWFLFRKLQAVSDKISQDLTAKLTSFASEIKSDIGTLRERLIELEMRTGRVSEIEAQLREIVAWREKTILRLERITHAVNRMWRHYGANRAQVAELDGPRGPITEEFPPKDLLNFDD